MSQDRTEGMVALGKLASVWAAVGITSWADAAAAAAFCYSMLLISEWIWKKLLRGLFERRGWVKPVKRPRRADETGPGEL